MSLPLTQLVLLSTVEMRRADALTIARGTPGIELMEQAGAAVADAVLRRWSDRPVVVLCGPGNNGGDGFVAARILREAGRTVHVGCLKSPDSLSGDAAIAAGRWGGEIAALDPALLDGTPAVVDALFGAGLERPIEGVAAEVIAKINAAGLHCIAVDVPSGVHGDSGAVLGVAPRSIATVTFFRRKPGHLLLPGRELCGTVEVADIGIPEDVLDEVKPRCWANGTALWYAALPQPTLQGHKYDRGHAVIFGGAELTGAARLAARAARRIGAGLVTIAAPRSAHAIYAADLTGTLTVPLDGRGEAAELLADRRRNAVLVGPGNGVGEVTAEHALAALKCGKAVVLDADGLTSFEGDPGRLFRAVAGPCVLTPHEGEFARLFPDLAGGSKLDRARQAAARSGAVVLLKGADTVIAAPDGRAAINSNAPPTLATAGTGDVLAGLVVGFLAQNVPPFEAAAASTWIHGAAAAAFGPGLIAEDVIDLLPEALRDLQDVSTQV